MAVMAKTVAGIFPRFLLAEDAVQNLVSAGFQANDISIVARDKVARGAQTSEQSDDTAGRAGAGAAIGGVAGLVLGLGALALPGIGPVVAAGPIAAALSSAGIGAAAGGILGALTGMNIPEDDAGHYAEAIRRGGAVVIVKTDDATSNVALDILNRSGAQDLEDLNVQQSDRAADSVSHSSDPASPQVTLSGARIYEDGLEMNPRKSRFEDFKPE